MSQVQKKVILVAEDSSFTRYTIIEILKEIGQWDFIEAVDGSQALKFLDSHKPDCLLLDLLMPVVDGFEVLAEMQKKEIKIPVIVFTADIQDTTRQKCINLGASEILNKPIDANVLKDTIKRALIP